MISFRPLSEKDFPSLLVWLQRPHVKQFWDDGDDTLEKVVAHYGADDGTRRFIAERNGAEIGYFQYDYSGRSEIGCDQFLCEPHDLSRGVGTECLHAFIDLIIAAEAPDAVVVDPHPANRRAIRCYEKCGFVHRPDRSGPNVHFMLRGGRRRSGQL